MHKAVIIGVGPDRGLGAQLCKRFAREGLHVVATGHTPASLDAVVADTSTCARPWKAGELLMTGGGLGTRSPR